jgi:hypothetical protein
MRAWLGVLLLLAPTHQGSAGWDEVWGRLERLKGMERGDPAAEPLLRELRAAVSSAAGGEGDSRRVLLEAEVERWSGRDPGLFAQRLAETPPATFTGREAWLLAEVLPAGPARVQAVLRALDDTAALGQDQLLFAWNVSVEEARALRYEAGALPIQERLWRRSPASWSGSDLSRTLSLIGRSAEADAVLTETIALEEAAGRPTMDLWSQRGIQTLGAGNEALARDYFGHALGQGSMDAALVLGREDLAHGRLDAARKGLRPPILSGDDTGWALRGWGLALLPAAHARAARPTLGPRPPEPPK